MNAKNFELAGAIVGQSYAKQAEQARHQRENLIKVLLSQRRLPATGWDDETIEMFFTELASMDTNNFVENIGVGEREGRIYSRLVQQRNFRLAHGVGRSGDLGEIQPKAAGSSLMYKLCNNLALDAIQTCGVTRVQSCIVVPMATGMTMSLYLLLLRQERPNANLVIWPRIDQKTCLKCISTSGLTPVVIANVLKGDEIVTNVAAIREAITTHGAANISCLVSTVSCFAPRAAENVVAIAELAKEFNIPHMINNAYGLQSSKICHAINEAIRLGRVDAIIQSTDKNFMVPVGGAIFSSADAKLVDRFAKTYAGRASAAPIMDLFITLLSMGKSGLLDLLKQRKDVFQYFQTSLTQAAELFGERVLVTPGNPISLAMSLSATRARMGKSIKEIGAALFHHCSSGVRVVNPADTKEVCGISFSSYGSHLDNYPTPYLNVAAAIGMRREEVDLFIKRLTQVLKDLTSSKPAQK